MIKVVNAECVEYMRNVLIPRGKKFNAVVADPPFGLDILKSESAYNRKKDNIIPGYVEVDKSRYAEFTTAWVSAASELLSDGGAFWVVSPWNNLRIIEEAIKDLKVINHIIWQYSFGMYTTRKFVNSHYHIYLLSNRDRLYTFNKNCRFDSNDDKVITGSAEYRDRQDVWQINKEYKTGKTRNSNQLPEALVEKMLLYTTNRYDVVLDPFSGGFTTAKVCSRTGRHCLAIEVNENACNYAKTIF